MKDQKNKTNEVVEERGGNGAFLDESGRRRRPVLPR